MRIDRTCQERGCSVLVCCNLLIWVLLSHGQLLKHGGIILECCVNTVNYLIVDLVSSRIQLHNVMKQ